MIKHLNILVRGFVQNVGFRYYSQKEAESLNLKGFVNNQDDSTVYIEIEGEENKLNQFINWCKTGPVKAAVKSVKIEGGPLKNYSEFRIMKR